jgi:hypothetical protein
MLKNKIAVVLILLAIISPLGFAKVVSGDTQNNYSEGDNPCDSHLASSLMCRNCSIECRNSGQGGFNFDTETFSCECSGGASDSNNSDLTANDCFKELLQGRNGDEIIHTDNSNGDTTMPLNGVYGQEGSEQTHRTEGAFQYRGGTAVRTMGEEMSADSFAGRSLRRLINWTVGWNESPEIYTYDQPQTSAFFTQVDSIQGTQSERIRQTYGLVVDAVPNYRHSNELQNLSFETMLQNGKGICREQAALLNAALVRQGIDSKLIITGTHAWVRVTVNQPGSECDGQTFDLDSTWYKSFVPLDVRN